MSENNFLNLDNSVNMSENQQPNVSVDIIKQIKLDSNFFDFVAQHTAISKAFENFHTSDMMELDLTECLTCKEKNTFVNYVCCCPFCKLYYYYCENAPVKEYVLHCFKCNRCLCNAQPSLCIGCALIHALITESHEILETYI
jgi:hypothetical protein